MNQRINKIIPDAIESIQKHMTTTVGGMSVPKEYKGDISSLGAGVIRSGLLPTLSFFSQATSNKEDTKNRRLKLIEAMKVLFLKHSYFKEKAMKHKDDNLLFLVIRLLHDGDTDEIYNANRSYAFDMDKSKESIIKKELNEIAIALKMALRVFNNE